MTEQSDVSSMPRLVTVDQGVAVVLPGDALAALGVGAGDEIHLEVRPGRIILSLRDPLELRQLDFAAEGMARYRNTLADLAK